MRAVIVYISRAKLYKAVHGKELVFADMKPPSEPENNRKCVCIPLSCLLCSTMCRAPVGCYNCGYPERGEQKDIERVSKVILGDGW